MARVAGRIWLSSAAATSLLPGDRLFDRLEAKHALMKWSKLIGLVLAALGLGTLCCCVPHSFGPGLRYIRNPMDSWPRVIYFALDAFGALLLVLSYFLFRARNWARLTLMGGCICFTILAVAGAVALGVSDPNLADDVYLAGLLIWSVAGPVLLIFILRQPDVANEFKRSQKLE